MTCKLPFFGSVQSIFGKSPLCSLPRHRTIDGLLSQVLNMLLELAAESWAAGTGRRTKAPPSTSIQLYVQCSLHGPESVAVSAAEWFGETFCNSVSCLSLRLKVFLGIRIM